MTITFLICLSLSRSGLREQKVNKIVINSLNAFMRYHVHKSGIDNEMMPLAKDISSAEALKKKTCSVKETVFTKALNKLTTLCFLSGRKVILKSNSCGE